jgi:hypothetical protein
VTGTEKLPEKLLVRAVGAPPPEGYELPWRSFQ